MEKYKELYGYSKEVFKEELDRFNGIDQKASHYLSVLTILLGVAGFFVNWTLERFLPPKSALELALFILTIMMSVALLIAWFFIFSVLRMQDIYKLPLDTETIEFFAENKEIDIYYYLSIGIKDSLVENRLIGNRKSKKLICGYNSICIAAVLLLIFAILFGLYKWREPKPETRGNSAMSEENKQQKPNSQPTNPGPTRPLTQPPPEKPTPGITPPRFPRVTTGEDPPPVRDPRGDTKVTMDE